MPDYEQRHYRASDPDLSVLEDELLATLEQLVAYGGHLDNTVPLPRRNGLSWTLEELSELARTEAAAQFGYEYADLLGTLALFLYTHLSEVAKHDELTLTEALVVAARASVQKLAFNFTRSKPPVGFNTGKDG